MVALAARNFLGNLDRINRRAYRRAGVLRQFGAATGWLEPGERAAVLSVMQAAMNQPILDIGIGGGRTVPLMQSISPHYCGIDYVPSMVEVARRRFPDTDLREMDARSLEFPDATFALATFSYNGIDSVDPEGRRAILREVHRVLRPGGYFVFSALNRDSVTGMPHWPDWSVFRGACVSPSHAVRATAKFVVGLVNWLHGQLLTRDDGNVAIHSLSAHNFALMTVFTSMAAELEELCQTGFVVEAIFDPAGRQVDCNGSGDISAPWHHFVIRKGP